MDGLGVMRPWWRFLTTVSQLAMSRSVRSRSGSSVALVEESFVSCKATDSSSSTCDCTVLSVASLGCS